MKSPMGKHRRDKYLVFGNPDIQESEIREVVETLKSGWISTGPRVHRFEQMFREYAGAKHAHAVNSCTAALHLSMLVTGIGQGDEVITCPMTFAATANAITHAGAVPVFVDCRKEDLTIDVSQVESRVTDRTRAILPIHFAGRSADMDPILEVAKRHGLLVLEDAAHAIETVYRSRKVGAIGDLTCFSFYVTKNVATGEGGMITTENDEYAARIETYALHGLSKGAWKRFSDSGYEHYEVVCPGYKYNMMDIQAALGIHQLSRIKPNLKRREEIWEHYDREFSDLPVFTPARASENTTHARHLYTLLLDIDRLRAGRDEIQRALHEENIGTGIHYVSLHLHKYYREKYGYRRGDFPNAEFVSDRTLSLPLSTSLRDSDVEDVVRAVRRVILQYA
jgi:dTDP-4-amino-4,6-dideoxygalactose transaminase